MISVQELSRCVCLTFFKSLMCPVHCSGKFVWTVRNLALFREMIKTQKIMSPAFPAGECSLRLSVYQSTVAGADFLSLCLESKVWVALLPS